MGEYAVGTATRERIMFSCEALFYEKGINDTSYEDICQDAKINRGLIPYYFKSKHNIAENIYCRLLQSIADAVTAFCKSFELSYMEITIAIELFTFAALQNDAKLCRFYSEIMGDSVFYETALREQSAFLRSVVQHNKLAIDERSFRTIAVMAQGTEIELVHSVSRDYLLETVPEFVTRDIMCTYSMLGIGHRKISEWCKRAVAITVGRKMVCDSHFNCEIIACNMDPLP